MRFIHLSLIINNFQFKKKKKESNNWLYNILDEFSLSFLFCSLTEDFATHSAFHAELNEQIWQTRGFLWIKAGSWQYGLLCLYQHVWLLLQRLKDLSIIAAHKMQVREAGAQGLLGKKHLFASFIVMGLAADFFKSTSTWNVRRCII